MIKPLKAIASLFFVWLFLACNKSLSSSNPISFSSMTIQSLTANNLSEDMNELSTKEDEILLLAFLVESQDDSLYITREWHAENTFKSRNEVDNINYKIEFNNTDWDKNDLLFMLIEIDSEQVVTSIISTLKQAIEKETAIKNIDDFKLDKLLEHDDFLDFQILDLNKINRSSPIFIKFSGLQMFDRFEYHLQLGFN